MNLKEFLKCRQCRIAAAAVLSAVIFLIGVQIAVLVY